MKSRSFRSLFFDFVFLPLLVVGVFYLSVYFESQKTQNEVRNYLSRWEEEISKELLVSQSSHLFEKIMGHVEHLEVTWLHASANSKAVGQQCGFPFEVSVTLYGLPAAELRFCQPLQSLQSLLLRSLMSSHFMGFLVILVLLMWVLRRENFRVEIEKKKISNRLEVASEWGRTARQVAHDLRTPLSSLLTLVQTLEPDQKGPRENLLKNSVERLKSIADDLHEQGSVSLDGQSSYSDLIRALRETCSEVHTLHSHQLLGFKIEERSALFFVGLGQKNWKRIFQNLSVNAFEAMEQKNTRLQLKIQTKIENHQVLILFQDEGVGIPAELVARLGQEGLSYGKSHGSGLGLAFVLKMLERIDAKLEIQSSQGQGTKITLRIPIRQAQLPVSSETA